MKKLIALVVLTALAGSAYAQLNPVPPVGPFTLSNIDPKNAGSGQWNANPGLQSYSFTSDENLNSPKPGNPDNVLGLNWASSSAQAIELRDQVNAKGGTIRAIFLGESAGWLNDFGYTTSGLPAGAGSFSIINNIQALSGTPYAVNIAFGDYVDINIAKNSAPNFDVWLNGVGGFGETNPIPPTQNGGVYTAFNPSNSNPYIGSGNVKWTVQALMVNTYLGTVDGLDVYQDVATYLVGFEDWRLDRKSDNDSNDFMIAFQFFAEDGTPFTPVPEPSTYGLIGAALLMGLVAFRRFKAKKA